MVQTTGYGSSESTSPDRGVGLKITFVNFDAAAVQQFQIRFAKCARPVMLHLLFDVMTNRFALGGTYRKRSITFLPCEPTHANLLVHPTRRNRLELTKHISQAMCCSKTDQKMDMIGHSRQFRWLFGEFRQDMRAGSRAMPVG